MATPIADRITDSVVAALSTVTSDGGEYSSTLYVKEPDHVADTMADGTCIVNEGDWTYEDNAPMGKDGIYQSYSLTIFVRGGDERNYQRLCRLYASDAKRALMQDETRGGLARWSKVTGASKFTDGAVRGVTLDYQVYFWTAKDQPDVQ
jgi:hypothetical protein